MFVDAPSCEHDGDRHQAENSCLSCHESIEPIRCTDSDMFRQILAAARKTGTNNRCLVCHGGNPDVRADDGPDDPVEGTDAFRACLARLAAREPQVFVSKMSEVPAAPSADTDFADQPEQAAFTYVRGECQRCHLGVGGKQRRGDYRSLGCSACHIPYGNAGQYQGGDRALAGAAAGRPLVHSIQSTHDSPVRANDHS